MIRVKLPFGGVTPEQMDAFAEVAEKFAPLRKGHITTRQNIQLHFIKIHDMEPAMRLLADVGMTTREACGNSVRNITACPYAGTAADELFESIAARHTNRGRYGALALDPRPDAVLIDGKPVKKYPLHQVALVKGDSLSFSIAAASIIAKVTLDRIMLKMAETYPQYGFEIHKGYPTPKHLAALKQHGPCPQHRRSFAPVAQLELDLG